MDNQVKIYSSGALVSAAAVITGETLASGNNEIMYVSRGGIADSTTVNLWGAVVVSSGGTALRTTAKAHGFLTVYSGGSGVSTTVNSDGYFRVYNGGMAIKTVMSGGSLYVSSGGTATDTVMSDSFLYIYSGGKVSNVITSGGSLYAASGGMAEGIVVQSDAECSFSGCKFSDVQILPGAEVKITGDHKLVTSNALGEIESATVSCNGVLTASCAMECYGAIVRSAAVLSGGSVVIEEACSAVGNVLSSGGSMTIRNLARAEDTRITGGTLAVLQGGIAIDSEISSRGKLILSGKAVDTTVSADGALFVLGGSVAENIAIDGGNVFVATGGEIKGDISISRSGGLYLYGGSIIDGDIHAEGTLNVDKTMVCNGHITVELNSDSAASTMIQNLDYLSGTDKFTVETASAAPGSYKLADGAECYKGTVAVSHNGSVIGTLSVGETKNFGGVDYTLARTKGVLSFSVGAVVRIPAKSDVDGNNISDVMFQYTGGDYQIGFWMNGTNTWQGQGVGQPSNWELLGAYDMDNNGKADIVMRGNIQIGADKGAYIGYYKDGDVTQWQNISFLNNSTDIDWQLAIGNLTGNEGCNSIVWHAPDFGALGVWTDGSANWVSLASGFNRDWTMLGCGDFDGNGKDEVLFEYGGNLYTTDIDQNFASLGGWGADWEVKAIGDFSGDGADDLILQNGSMVIKFDDGKAENWSAVGVMDASDWFIVGAGDYNGDEADDLLVRQYSTGMLGYYANGDMSQWVEMGRGVDMNWSVIA